MDFAIRPPETNSGQIYTGAGSGPMTSAATAWDELAAGLDGLSAHYGALTAELCAGRQGPAAAVMAPATAQHQGWLQAVGAHARQAASRLKAAADAYEAAFAAVVPPAQIEANRTRRASLASANALAQTAPDIADADADYEHMW
ncbi:MAG: PPE domain-containing protein, partial [Mycobacterium sp.]|nr:PPE domain-containing protein [Mycobacterium sp.]